MRKKLAGSLFMASIMLGLVGQPAQVAEAKTITISASKPSGVSFNSAWEKTTEIYYSGSNAIVGELCYGFDTVATDEDYAWARSWFYKHKAKVKNDKGTYASSERKASTSNGWAKKEITHKGKKNQKYYIVFTNATSTDSKSDYSKQNTKNSNNKSDD